MPKATKDADAIASESKVKSNILAILNGKKELEDTRNLPSIPEDFRVLKCEMTGMIQGVKISSWVFLPEGMEEESMAKDIASYILKMYRKRLSDSDVTAITDKLQEMGRSEALSLRNINFSFRWMDAADAFSEFIVSHYGEFIFEHLITGEAEKEAAFYTLFPKDNIAPEIMQDAITQSIARGMKKRAHGAILLAENAIRLPLDNLIFNFFLTANRKEWIIVTDCEFRGDWWMCARQELVNTEQVSLLRSLDHLEKIGEKAENGESRHFVKHLLRFVAIQGSDIKEKADGKSFGEQLRMLSSFFDENLPMSLYDLHRWVRGIIFSYTGATKEVEIFMLHGPNNVASCLHEKTPIARIAVKDFIDPCFMKEFFGENKLYGEIPEK